METLYASSKTAPLFGINEMYCCKLQNLIFDRCTCSIYNLHRLILRILKLAMYFHFRPFYYISDLCGEAYRITRCIRVLLLSLKERHAHTTSQKQKAKNMQSTGASEVGMQLQARV